MDCKEALEYIRSTGRRGSKPGLERIRRLCALIGNPQKGLKFIHIAGTNGKGSAAAFISSILYRSGYKTGLFTSPYLETYNERMQINGKNIPDDELARIVSFIRPYAEAMDDLPTEFEINTAVAFEYFKRSGCDIVVLEAGMGGELDSTNVIGPPVAAVITHIALDHTRDLGNTVTEIARTKSKIIKPGCETVLYKQDPQVMEVIAGRCAETGSRLSLTEPESIELLDRDIGRQVFRAEGFGTLAIPLIGTYQLENAAAALKTVQVLRRLGYAISTSCVSDGLESTKWPGRFEVISRSPLFIADGAHNPDGMRAAAESLENVLNGEKVILIFGVMADKNYEEMLDIILPYARFVCCMSPDNARALPADELARAVRSRGMEAAACGCAEEAVSLALRKAGRSLPVLAAGSLYMVGDIRKLVLSNM